MIPAVVAAACVLVAGARVGWASPARRPTACTTATSATPVSTASPRAAVARRRRRGPARRATVDGPAAVAAWCDRLARAVRSGSSLHAAVRSEEPPAGEADVVAAIVLALDRGVPLREALAVRARSPHMRLALTVVRACASQGGPAAEPLDRAAAVLRSRDADLAERRAQSAQARLSALVMTVLPVAVLMLLVTTSASVRAELRTPLGLTVVLSGAALNVAGWRWMRHVIDGVAR